ncbi:MAG: VOC family protein [Candidatus Pacebacteria bacterium]|jgi:catechol 2,3-dioxygenase-like lactoylglutathione lyase family enzyme|nr:VOC family protein [Candidatus Paceibacterota bacterium]
MLKNINILGFYVSDIGATVDFYSKIGFQKTRQDGNFTEMMLGPMKLRFNAKETAREQDASFHKDAFGEPKGLGLYINIEVEGIDDHYQSLIGKGLKPSTTPRNWPWGHREFVIRDPDGYKIVFYEITNGSIRR